MITRIQIGNLKEQEADRLLGPISLIVGKNQVGKTALLDGIKIGLLGYHPSLGKRRQDTMLLASGDPMRVRLETTKGVFAGEWPTKGSVRYSSPCDVPPVLLDLSEFSDKTGGQRLDMLLAAAGVTIGASALVAKLQAVRIENHGKEAQEALDKLVYDIAVRLGHGEQAKESPLNTLYEISVDLAGKVSQLREQVKNYDASLKAQSEQTSAVALQSRKEDIEKLEGERQRLTTKLSDITSKIAEGERWAKVRAQITETLAKTEGIEARLESAIVAAENAALEVGKEKKRVEADQVALDQARQALYTAKAELEVARKGVSECEVVLEQARSRKECPTCRRKFTITQQEAAARDARTDFEIAKKQEAKALEVYNAADAQEKKCQTALSESRKALESANLMLIQFNGTLDFVRQERNSRSVALTQQESLGQPVDVEALKKEKEDAFQLMTIISADLLRARNEEAAYQREQGVKALREQTRLSAMEARIGFAICQGVQKAVAEYKESLVKSKIDQALGVLRELGLKVLSRDLIFLDGDIGYLNHGRFVSSRTFSGIEQKVTFAALGLALAVNAPFRIMLLDEMGVFTPEAQSTLLRTVSDLIAAKLLDQFIGVTWNWSNSDLHGITLIEV